VQQKAVALAGVLYIAMAIFHIPDQIFRHGFDKNAPAQLFFLLMMAGVFALFITFKAKRFQFHKLALYGAGALVLTQLASVVLSGNLLGSLVGDTGRFVGTLSACALLLVATFNSQFDIDAFTALSRYYILAIEAVVLIGIAQHFNLIELPGDHGMSATLGNVDFFAAFVGTSLPLILFLFLRSVGRVKVFLIIAGAINLLALYWAGPLQAYVDIAFTLLGIAILLIRKFIPRRNWTLNARTYLGTFAVVIWAEFIFLMPFLGDFIPVLGNDVQVKIRSNFWLAGMRQFFSHPLFGVGPDQYGNNYEQYRTLDDIQKYSNILSNDAHSASVQTLATVGILGTLAFLFLIALVIRSLLILWDSQKIDRKALFALGLYIFVYLTNSFVSPITLTNKVLFWGVCGFIVGQVYRLPSGKQKNAFALKVVIAASSVLFIGIAVLFAQAQINYLSNLEKYAKDNKAVINYSASPLMPCFMYFDTDLLIAKNAGPERAMEVASQELSQNPRCVAAQTHITEVTVNSGEVEKLGPMVYKLFKIAPARSTTISFGMYYVNRSGDQVLGEALRKQMKVLGLVYIPGKLG
jgi:O-antigen ligase